MAVTAYWYAKAMINAFNQDMVMDFDNVYCMLCTNSYTPDQDTHEDLADGPRTNEVSGTGYTADGAALANQTETNTLNVVKLDADDVTWSNSTITARHAVLYHKGGTDATSALMSWVDFGEDKSSESGDFTIQWDTGGIATITVTDAP